ncbi:MAG: MotA/TolQ/ExbB proton channel family protein [Microbacteriaceae bacterium]
MSPSTIIGILLALGALYAMITMEGAHVEALLLPAPMILVFGATIAVAIASGTIGDAKRALFALPKAFVGKVNPPAQTIEAIVGYAERARRDGLLALEQEAAEVDDPLIKNALQNIADGTDAEELRIILEDTVDSRIQEEKKGGKFFMLMAGYAPTIGIVGTVVSLTHVLENLDKPDELGHMIAAAFVATLWGLLSANFFWAPIGGKLSRLAELEEQRLAVVIEGMLAVQAGSQPRVLGERLRAMLPPSALPKQQGEAA